MSRSNINHNKPALFLIYCCFFLSGAAGLIYEVVWARQLGLFLGITSYAHTAVITAYMIGLAAGSFWIGKRSDSVGNPLRIYAWLEIGVGLYAASTPWLFDLLQNGYAHWAGVAGIAGTGAHLSRFAIALLALLIPTFLMGGTLPLLVRGVTLNLPRLGAVTGGLYGTNTLGATVGTALAGFVLLPRLGVVNTIMTAVVINLGIAVLVLVFVSKTSGRIGVKRVAAGEKTEPAELTSSMDTATKRILLTGFGAAGFSALLVQLAWIRTMILIVGGSVYAFTITLTAFLAGIGIGSVCYARWLSGADAPHRRMELAALLAAGISLFILFSLVVISRLPELFLAGYARGWVSEFQLYRVFLFGLSFTVMFLPTLLMGALFPLLAVTWTNSYQKAGTGIGVAYAVNTAGTILGALLGGLLLLPWLGNHKTIMLAVVIYALIAGGFWLSGGRRRPLLALSCVFILALTAWLVPPWDKAVMAGGVYYNPDTYIEAAAEGQSLRDTIYEEHLLYHEEGLHGTVTVTANERQKYLVINGKADASSVGDLTTQVTLGQLPALFHRNPQNALVIGLGTGITAGALATHKDIDNITVLEISEQVIEASDLFLEENRGVLADPRVEVVAADARNYVLATDQQWDIIVSEPSNPWISGVSNLFTQDFFHMLKKRLAPGGVMAQWFHMYGLSTSDLKTVLRTFAENHAFVSIWHMQVGDLIMIGSDDPHKMSLQHLQAVLDDPVTGPDLVRAQFTQARDLVRHYLFSREDILRYTNGAALNTDNRPLVEFNAPRNLYTHRSASNMADIIASIDNRKLKAPLSELFTIQDGNIDAEFMGLEIRAAVEAVPQSLESSWIVWRHLFDSDRGYKVGLGSSRRLQWSENQSNFVLEALRHERAPNAETRQRLMRDSTTLPIIAEGPMDFDVDPLAHWMLGTDADQEKIEIVLLWTCPLADGGVSRFVLRSIQPVPVPQSGQEDARIKAGSDLAGRIACH